VRVPTSVAAARAVEATAEARREEAEEEEEEEVLLPSPWCCFCSSPSSVVSPSIASPLPLPFARRQEEISLTVATPVGRFFLEKEREDKGEFFC
jgi:hypothetical protein